MLELIHEMEEKEDKEAGFIVGPFFPVPQ